MLSFWKVQSQRSGLADAVSGGGGECRRGADAYRGVGPDELGLYDLARQERIRTTNSGRGQRRRFGLSRSSAHASALGLARAAAALHPSGRAGLSRLRGVLPVLRRRLCRQEPRQHQRRSRACHGKARGPAARNRRDRNEAQGLPPSRPLSVLEVSLRGLEQDQRWQSSKSCLEATTDASRSFCKSYFELKAETASASEAARIDERIAKLKNERRSLEEQGAGREADNQAAVLARVFGLEAAKVERRLMLFLAVLVEIGAALGLYFATGHLRPVGSVMRSGAGG